MKKRFPSVSDKMIAEDISTLNLGADVIEPLIRAQCDYGYEFIASQVNKYGEMFYKEGERVQGGQLVQAYRKLVDLILQDRFKRNERAREESFSDSVFNDSDELDMVMSLEDFEKADLDRIENPQRMLGSLLQNVLADLVTSEGIWLEVRKIARIMVARDVNFYQIESHNEMNFQEDGDVLDVFIRTLSAQWNQDIFDLSRLKPKKEKEFRRSVLAPLSLLSHKLPPSEKERMDVLLNCMCSDIEILRRRKKDDPLNRYRPGNRSDLTECEDDEL